MLMVSPKALEEVVVAEEYHSIFVYFSPVLNKNMVKESIYICFDSHK